MNIINPTTTKSHHNSQHKNRVDLVSESRDHRTHDYEVELEQAVAAGDKDTICEIAKKLVEHETDKTDPLLTVDEIAMKLHLCTRSIWTASER